MNPSTPVKIVGILVFLSFVTMTIATGVTPSSGTFDAPLELTITDTCLSGYGHTMVAVDNPDGSYNVERIEDRNGFCQFVMTFRGPAVVKKINHVISHSMMDESIYRTFDVNLIIK